MRLSCPHRRPPLKGIAALPEGVHNVTHCLAGIRIEPGGFDNGAGMFSQRDTFLTPKLGDMAVAGEESAAEFKAWLRDKREREEAQHKLINSALTTFEGSGPVTPDELVMRERLHPARSGHVSYSREMRSVVARGARPSKGGDESS